MINQDVLLLFYPQRKENVNVWEANYLSGQIEKASHQSHLNCPSLNLDVHTILYLLKHSSRRENNSFPFMPAFVPEGRGCEWNQ